MKQELHIVIEQDKDGWFVGSVPSLPGCHTQARSLDELTQRIQEAIEVYLDAVGDDMVINKFVGVQMITVGS